MAKKIIDDYGTTMIDQDVTEKTYFYDWRRNKSSSKRDKEHRATDAEFPQDSRINTTILLRATVSVNKKVTEENDTTMISQDMTEKTHCYHWWPD